jgi:hypothetical protein
MRDIRRANVDSVGCRRASRAEIRIRAGETPAGRDLTRTVGGDATTLATSRRRAPRPAGAPPVRRSSSERDSRGCGSSRRPFRPGRIFRGRPGPNTAPGDATWPLLGNRARRLCSAVRQSVFLTRTEHARTFQAQLSESRTKLSVPGDRTTAGPLVTSIVLSFTGFNLHSPLRFAELKHSVPDVRRSSEHPSTARRATLQRRFLSCE